MQHVHKIFCSLNVFFWTSSQKNDKVLLTTYAICSRLFYLIAFLLYPPSFPFCLASLPGSKLQ